MADEPPKCKTCGTVLQGRDVYEGVCKRCREEVVLGASTTGRKTRYQPPSTLPPSPPPALPPKDAIAVESSVDLDADTKEIPADERIVADAASDATAPEAKEEPPVPVDSDVIPSPFGPSGEGKLPFVELATPQPPPEAATGEVSQSAQVPATPAPVIRHMEKPLAEGGAGVKRSYESFHGDSEAPPKLGRPTMLPKAEQPKVQPVAAPLARSGVSLELAPAEGEAQKAAEAPAEPLVEVVAEEPGPPRVKAPSTPSRDAEARLSAPPVAPEAIKEAIRLHVDTVEGKMKALIDDLAGQVEQLSKVLAVAHQVSPHPFWFGFRAFFGFIVGMGVLAAVAAGLLALVGTLFYPPALDLLKAIFTRSGPP